MPATRSTASLGALAFSVGGLAFAAAVALQHRGEAPQGAAYTLALLGASFLAVLLVFTARHLSAYRWGQVLRGAFYLVLVPLTPGSEAVEHVLLAGVVVELGVCEPFPVNTAASAAIVAAAVGVRAWMAAAAGTPATAWAMRDVPFALLGLGLAVFVGRMIAFREATIDLQQENRRLADSVVKLTRANAEYLDYARSAQQAGMEEERKRITRDIHDVVGYTLTNNIMLMESAMDMMNENPLGIPTVIETARANAEEGLGQIRRALYDLRRQDLPFPVGLRAIQRLAEIFQKATGIHVRCEYGNVPWSLGDDVDSVLYHLVQEGLVNAFRHGKAGEATVLLWMDGGAVHAQIADDGVGAAEIVEGIGLQGMRERVAALGGTLEVSGASGRFTVRAQLPVKGSASE
jgi:signal transduction histidine kinase